MDVLIRDAQEQDLEAVYAISRSVHISQYSKMINESHYSDFVSYYMDDAQKKQAYKSKRLTQIKSQNWSLRVAESGGSVIGFILFENGIKGPSYCRGLYILNEFQGCGIGGLLMQDWIGSEHGDIFELEVVQKNVEAIRFYEKFGFTATGVHNRRFFGEPMIKMQRTAID